MTLCFMAILVVIIAERIDARLGATLLWPLIATGVLSLVLWHYTGDLRLYGWVQFFPCLALLLLILIFPPKYSGTVYWVVAASLYALAKAFELNLKHLFAAAACFAVLRYFQTRQLIVPIDR
jgi:hypothetical protein